MPIRYEKRGKIGYITVEGRGDYNLTSPETVYNPLHDTLLDFGRDPDVWVAIVTAPSDRKCFCGGADLVAGETRRRADPSFGRASMRERFFRPPPDHDRWWRLITDGIGLYKPVIFAVHRYCVAAGTVLLMALADIVVATEDAAFGYVEIRRAIGPNGPWGPFFLTRQLPWRIGMEMLLTGRMMGSQEALRLGFINRVVPTVTQLIPAATAIAEEICVNPPLVVQAAKRLAIAYRDMPNTPGLLQAQLFGQVLLDTPDSLSSEGSSAFLQKRKPVYTGNLV